MSSPLDMDLGHYRLFLLVATGLMATHAYLKLSPYFALTWFGAGLVFGWIWAARAGTDAPLPEQFLLPVLVVYQSAAVTKGLVERREGVAGNHVVHVLLTGLLAGLLVLPFEASARAMGWGLPPAGGGAPVSWLGGVPLGALLGWSVMGAVFYGAYKLLDHCGVGRALQAVLLYAAVPWMVRLVELVPSEM